MTSAEDLATQLRRIAGGGEERSARLDAAVAAIAAAFEARTCTLHRAKSGEQLLELEAAVGLPDHVRQIVATVPFGKGMAGICVERREPITVCNLQTDDSGVVRPGAKDTKVAGALVVPILTGDDVRGTLGIGKAEDHDYSEDEIAQLRTCGEILADLL